jgi:hypothetical protein
MSEWTILWLAWVALFFAIELPAVFNKTKDDTLSEHLWKWFAVKDERPTGWVWVRRSALALGLTWIVVHLVTGGVV